MGIRVSVIIPTLNSARFVGEAIQSVLSQAQPDLEILVIDGGSSDGTQEIARKSGGEVIVLPQQGRGRPGARNTGLRQARGAWIAFLDSDDTWRPEKLRRQLALFDQHPELDFVFGDMAMMLGGKRDDKPEILDPEIHAHLSANPIAPPRILDCLLQVNFIPTSSVVFRSSCLATIGYMNEEYADCEDYEYWLRFAAEARPGFVPSVLVDRRIHEANAMIGAYAENCEANLRLLGRWANDARIGEATSRMIRGRMRQIRYNLASYVLKKGDFCAALDNLRILRSDPGAAGSVPAWKINLKWAMASSASALFARRSRD